MLANSIKTRTTSIPRMLGVFRYVGAISGGRAFTSVATRFPHLPAVAMGDASQAKVNQMKFATGFGGVTGAIKPSPAVQLNATAAASEGALKKKTTKPKKLEKVKLREKLNREKKKLKKIEAALKERQKLLASRSKDRQKNQEKEKKEKEKKEAEKQKRLINKALQPVRGLSSWSLYIKKKTTADKDMKQLSEDFRNLSESERREYERLAEEYNAKLKERYPARPKIPPLGYALYVQQNFPAGVTAAEAMTSMANDWRQLSPEEKEKYNVVTEEIRDKFNEELKKWKDQRVANYLEDKKKPKVDI